MPRAHVGMAGWVYPPWRGTFYPAGLRQADELAYAANMDPIRFRRALMDFLESV